MGNYHEELSARLTLRLRELLNELPAFLKDFFRSLTDNTSARTRIGYAYDMKVFFDFLAEQGGNEKKAKDFTLDDLARVSAGDIEEFMDYLDYYIKGEGEKSCAVQNGELGKSRKLSAVRTMFAYYYKKRKLESNPAALVDFPKIHEKAIVRLEYDEVAKLLDRVESGEGLTERQKAYHEYTKVRDLAIITMLLGTGMRVSELVGIDIGHIDFETGGIKITRKGGNEAIVYFGDEVREALDEYLLRRGNIVAAEGSGDALFLSMQNGRLTVRAVQNLVKKYSQLVTALKKITPHKLRSTFGTNLYRETGDIYLVADVLGHRDVNTTRKHYADMSDENRRKAARAVKLRKDD